MGNCWAQWCCGLFFRREAGRLQRGGGSKYFRTCSTGEHFTIEENAMFKKRNLGEKIGPTVKVTLSPKFENLVESDEGESPGSSHRYVERIHVKLTLMLNQSQNSLDDNAAWEKCTRQLNQPLTEEEIADLKDRHYDSIAEKQRVVDMKLQSELALQEEKLRIEEEALYAAQREAARAAKQKKLLEQRRQQRIMHRAHAVNNGEYPSSVAEEDLDSFLRNTKFQYEAFRSSRLSSDATVLTPNTESSCDLMTKTKSTSGNDDSTSLDLEWEDEEGMNRMIPMRERSKTEEDILRAALKFNSKKTGSNPASASDDSNGLEWENDFVSAEMDDNGNSEYAGFVNPVLDLSASDVRISDSDHQDR